MPIMQERSNCAASNPVAVVMRAEALSRKQGPSLMKFSDHAQAEKRLAGLVGYVHSPFDAGFNRIGQLAKQLAGRFRRFFQNRTYVWKLDCVAVV
jgi:hypothetical protein